jgi:hypothetical protein
MRHVRRSGQVKTGQLMTPVLPAGKATPVLKKISKPKRSKEETSRRDKDRGGG